MPSDKPVRTSREIYTDILKNGLLAIRAADDLNFARAVADHLHNLPSLLQHLEHAGLHDHYWRVQRATFLQQVTPEQARWFERLWEELEAARKVETRLI